MKIIIGSDKDDIIKYIFANFALIITDNEIKYIQNTKHCNNFINWLSTNIKLNVGIPVEWDFNENDETSKQDFNHIKDVKKDSDEFKEIEKFINSVSFNEQNFSR